MTIPFLKPTLPSAERYHKHINAMHDHGWFSNNGPLVQRFERDLQEYLQTHREVIAVSNATIGLILALRALQTQGTVLIPSFTFAATAGAVQWAGLSCEYVDIDNTWCMDPANLEKCLKNKKYAAVMPVHTQGNPCNIKQIEDLCRQYSTPLIFDAASGIGASYNDQRIGNFGDMEVFSLHATKCLPVGEGGFIAVKDKQMANKIRQLQNFGFSSKRSAELDGTNAKMSELTAAVGIEALQDLKQHMRNRRKYAALYKKELKGVVDFQPECPNGEHGLQILSGTTCKPGEEVERLMAARGVQVRRYYSPPVHQHPAYAQQVSLPNTTKLASNVVSLPLYSIMDDNTIEYVCQSLKEIVNGV